MVYVRELTRGEHPYYELVESYRNDDGEPRTRVIEYLGKTPLQTPGPFELTGSDFGRLAIPMMEETLTPEDVLVSLKDMGHPIEADELEEVGLRFLFQESCCPSPSPSASRTPRSRGLPGLWRCCWGGPDEYTWPGAHPQR